MTINLVYDEQIFCIQRYGGVSRCFIEIASRLQKDARFHVRIIAPLHINAYLSKYSGNVIGHYIPSIPRTEGYRWSLNSRLAILWLKAVKPDIIHETYYRYKGDSCKGSKRIVTVHDMIHEKFPHFFSQNNHSERKALAVNRADHIICVSENTKKDLVELLKISSDKITVIYHGSSLHPGESSIKNSSERHHRPYILYVGNRGQYKNFEGLLRAYSLSGKLQKDFGIVCFGSYKINNTEKNLIRNLGIKEGNVKYVRGDDMMLAVYYYNASAFVFPSLYEGFGIPLLEAMSCHSPIACSNTSCFEEIAGDAAEYFDPSNIENMTDAIQRIVYSSYRTTELILLGEERVKLFSWDKTAAQTAKVYSLLV